MKKNILLTVLFTVFSNINIFAQSATIEQVWVDHNVVENGQAGMKIHAKVTTHNCKGRTFSMGVIHYFEFTDGRKLIGYYPEYRVMLPDGTPQVTTETRFDVTPAWDHTVYHDCWRFIPYYALSLSEGSYKLCFYTFVFDYTSGRYIQEAPITTYFDFGSGPTPPRNNQVFDFTKNNPGVAPIGGGNNINFNNDNNNTSNTNHHKREPHPRKCESCFNVGTGLCRVCAGKGKHQLTINSSPDDDCFSCGGTGRCRFCKGTGLSGVVDYY